MIGSDLSASVVVCAYTDRRWPEIGQAVRGLAAQTSPPHEVLLVVDHNPQLAARARAEFPAVTVLENSRRRGLSGARNTGVAAASGEVIAFLDDDATPRADWLENLLAPYRDPAVLAVGGAAHPLWPNGSGRPRWLPARVGAERGELDWIIGCTYAGQPLRRAETRNLMGCNMSFRREVFAEVGGFTEDIGRIGSIPLGCEETELCIRLRQRRADARIVFEPSAIVGHHVDDARTRAGYLRRRSWAEGVSKAAVAALVGADDALSTERAYLRRVLPAALLRQVSAAARGRRGALAGAVAIVVSVLCTAAGYLRGGLSARLPAPRRAVDSDPDAIYLTTHDIRRGSGELRVPTVDSRDYRRAQVLLRDGRRTVGVVRVPVRDGLIDLTGVAATGELATAAPSGPATGPAPKGHRPLVSVVVPTVDRPQALTSCVKSLLGNEYADLEIIVVDNRPTGADDSRWRDFCGIDARIRYVAEPRPGVSHARNTGLAEARGEYVAFVDDDIEVDRWWLPNLVAELENPAIDCATSLVLPARLDTSAQRAFEDLKGFGQGLRRQVFGPELAASRPDYPFAPGQFGPGGCAVWRRSTLHRLGGFDPLLGPGTPGRAGEDLHLFLRLARAGGSVVYTPHAVAFHEHAAEWPELRARIRGYGTGLSAMLLLHLLRRPADLPRLARVVPGRVRRVLRAGPSAADSTGNPAGTPNPAQAVPSAADPDLSRRLLLDQCRGLLSGPFALARSAYRDRRTRRRDPGRLVGQRRWTR